MILSETHDYLSLVALILVLFIMSIFVLAFLAVGFFNIKKIINSSILFYSLLGALLLSKLIAYFYFAINFILIVKTEEESEKKNTILSSFETFYKNGMFISDFAICSMLLIMLKGFHALQTQAFLDKDSSVIKNVWTIIQLLELIGFAVFIGLYDFGIISFVQTSISIAILNLLPCALYISLNIYANITMTGALAEPEIAQRLKSTNKRLFWFFFSRIVQGAYEILLVTDVGNTPFVNVILNIEKTTGQPVIVLICFGIYLLITLLTQLIPFIVSVRASTIRLLEPISVVTSLKQSLLTSNSSFIDLIKSNEDQEYEKNINVKDFQTIEVLSQGQNGFGVVKKGNLKGKIMVLRTIETQLSKYLREDITKDIQQVKKMQVQGLMQIRFSLLQNTCASFITNYYDTNLRKIIDSKKSLNESVRLMYDLTEVITELHKKNEPHGTLKVNNIYIAGTHIKVADFGLLSLKRFLSITKGYTNKSIYTAPELLSGRHSIIIKPTKEGDIYALGMIMFEVFSGQTNFRNLTIQQVQQSFKNKRPKIPNHIPTQLQNLIRNCWQQDPTLRPSIEEVGIVLREYKNKFH